MFRWNRRNEEAFLSLELRIALRRTRFTEPLLAGRVESSLVTLQFIPVEPISRAFRRAIRDREFDVTEMALVTLAIANDAGEAWLGLPVALAAGSPHDALHVKLESPVRGPADLTGRSIGVRAYSQTTGVWFRGILETEYGISPRQMRWITTEDAHVPNFADPEFVTRAPAGVSIEKLFASGEIDAAIGDSATNLGETRSVIAEPEVAAAEWSRRTGIRPVNHVLALRPGLAMEYPWLGRELLRMFGDSGAAVCDAASVEACLGFAKAQGLTRRLHTYTDLFAR
jgi:4,5-dihydroxyphthalate decarboxylase